MPWAPLKIPNFWEIFTSGNLTVKNRSSVQNKEVLNVIFITMILLFFHRGSSQWTTMGCQIPTSSCTYCQAPARCVFFVFCLFPLKQQACTFVTTQPGQYWVCLFFTGLPFSGLHANTNSPTHTASVIIISHLLILYTKKRKKHSSQV